MSIFIKIKMKMAKFNWDFCKNKFKLNNFKMGKIRVKENIFKWLVKIKAIKYQNGIIMSNKEYQLD